MASSPETLGSAVAPFRRRSNGGVEMVGFNSGWMGGVGVTWGFSWDFRWFQGWLRMGNHQGYHCESQLVRDDNDA